MRVTLAPRLPPQLHAARTDGARRSLRLGGQMNMWLAVIAAQCLTVGGAVPTVGSEPDTLPRAEEILERYVEAVGGRAAFERLRTRVVTGWLITDLPSREPPVLQVSVLEMLAKSPDRCLIVQRGADGVRRAGFDGEVGWLDDAGGVKPHDHLERSKLAWLMNPQYALRLSDYFGDAKRVERERWGRREVYVVRTERDPAQFSLFFDVETSLLIRIGHNWNLQDYREVDGIRLPHRIIESRKGGSSTYVIDRVQHGVELEEARFAMPVD